MERSSRHLNFDGDALCQTHISEYRFSPGVCPAIRHQRSCPGCPRRIPISFYSHTLILKIRHVIFDRTVYSHSRDHADRGRLAGRADAGKSYLEIASGLAGKSRGAGPADAEVPCHHSGRHAADACQRAYHARRPWLGARRPELVHHQDAAGGGAGAERDVGGQAQRGPAPRAYSKTHPGGSGISGNCPRQKEHDPLPYFGDDDAGHRVPACRFPFLISGIATK